VRYHTLPVTSFFGDQDEYGKEKRGKAERGKGGGNVLESLPELGGSYRAHSLWVEGTWSDRGAGEIDEKGGRLRGKTGRGEGERS